MNINHHNYEDFFILYLDNELNQEERKAVEDFLLANPDLQREMDSLKQTIFSPDQDLVFEGKEQLMVGDSSLINIYNYESFLVQHVDGELLHHEVVELEKFLALNPYAQQELNWLKKTRSEPDTAVVFGDKSSLYRHEEVKRMYPVRWLKQAIAAAVIIAAGTGIFMFSNNSGDTDAIITASEPSKQTIESVIDKTIPSTNNENQTADAEPATSSPIIKDIIEKNPAPVQFAAVQQPVKKQQPQNTDDDMAAATTNELEKPIGIPVRVKEILAEEDRLYANLHKQNINEQVVTNDLPVRTTNEASPENNQFIYAADVEPENKKIRGFFRKATRIFERTTNIAAANEDDKLLVGGFAINLK